MNMLRLLLKVLSGEINGSELHFRQTIWKELQKFERIAELVEGLSDSKELIWIMVKQHDEALGALKEDLRRLRLETGVHVHEARASGTSSAKFLQGEGRSAKIVFSCVIEPERGEVLGLVVPVAFKLERATWIGLDLDGLVLRTLAIEDRLYLMAAFKLNEGDRPVFDWCSAPQGSTVRVMVDNNTLVRKIVTLTIEGETL